MTEWSERGFNSSPVEALEQLREREREDQRRRRTCQCLDHRPLRKYLGVWQCMLCLRPREATEPVARNARR